MLKATGPTIDLELLGNTISESKQVGRRQSPRGVVTKLLGTATFDPTTARFSKFEMVALGHRWGYTTFNDRQRDKKSNPLGFVFQLADPDEPPNVPAFIWGYKASWLHRR